MAVGCPEHLSNILQRDLTCRTFIGERPFEAAIPQIWSHTMIGDAEGFAFMGVKLHH